MGIDIDSMIQFNQSSLSIPFNQCRERSISSLVGRVDSPMGLDEGWLVMVMVMVMVMVWIGWMKP